MNDVILFGSIFAGIVAALVTFGVFHIYRGLNDSLTNAKVGTVYNFEYLQPVTGLPERYMAKVLDVNVMPEGYISILNRRSRYRRNDPTFQRTKHLVTAQTFDGKIRNFYAERTRNVRRPLLGNLVFKSGLASLLF
jgi:hypothetical protein